MIKLDKNLIYIFEYNEIEATHSSKELKKIGEQILNILYKQYENILIDCFKKLKENKKVVEELKRL